MSVNPENNYRPDLIVQLLLFFSRYFFVFYQICTWLQSIPKAETPSDNCRDFTADSSVMGDNPAFSASAMGISSSASAKLRTAYCQV